MSLHVEIKSAALRPRGAIVFSQGRKPLVAGDLPITLSPERAKEVAPRGFTLMEVLVVAAVIALLMAILLPSLRQARVQSRRTVCQANLKQIAFALNAYID